MGEQLNQLMTRFLVVYVVFTSCQSNKASDIRCLQCFSVETPETCQQWAMCGHGEECFTREYVDHTGKQSFRLGCESTSVCNGFLYAQSLLGRRAVVEDVPGMCYLCCDTNDCNSRLCRDAVGRHVTTSTPVKICPPMFSAYNGHCYYLATWLVSWATARTDCKRRGADLVSINSKLEQDFLAQMIDKLNSTLLPVGIWTGGFWVDSTAQWNWLDNTAVNYTSWGISKPTAPADTQHIAMMKDTTHLTSDVWLWANVADSTTYGFICERNMF